MSDCFGVPLETREVVGAALVNCLKAGWRVYEVAREIQPVRTSGRYYQHQKMSISCVRGKTLVLIPNKKSRRASARARQQLS
jgi:hypothetical protein